MQEVQRFNGPTLPSASCIQLLITKALLRANVVLKSLLFFFAFLYVYVGITSVGIHLPMNDELHCVTEVMQPFQCKREQHKM